MPKDFSETLDKIFVIVLFVVFFAVLKTESDITPTVFFVDAFVALIISGYFYLAVTTIPKIYNKLKAFWGA